MKTIIPAGYLPKRSIRETETAIRDLRDIFQVELAEKLNLLRVSAPLFVKKDSGFNDNLNGVERPVSFETKLEPDTEIQIVHSLAKWKRFALKRYGFKMHEGLFTNMNAIRRDEDVDNLHSIYVDQWDWEKIIAKDERNDATLEKVVKEVYSAILAMRAKLAEKYDNLYEFPAQVHFVTSEELEKRWPDLTPKEREDKICEEFGAVFIKHIGGKLPITKKPHDLRAPDYDDWTLNGDLLFWNPVLKCAFEVSSMGIRVDEVALKKQLELTDTTDRLKLPFHQMLMKGELPYTIGGGIGQSRLCMLLLKKAHIGEVQASQWPEEVEKACAEGGITLL